MAIQYYIMRVFQHANSDLVIGVNNKETSVGRCTMLHLYTRTSTICIVRGDMIMLIKNIYITVLISCIKLCVQYSEAVSQIII